MFAGAPIQHAVDPVAEVRAQVFGAHLIPAEVVDQGLIGLGVPEPRPAKLPVVVLAVGHLNPHMGQIDDQKKQAGQHPDGREDRQQLYPRKPEAPGPCFEEGTVYASSQTCAGKRRFAGSEPP